MIAPCFASRPAPIASVNATTAGSPSGIAATASDTAPTNRDSKGCPRRSPSTMTTTMTTPAMAARVLLRLSICRCSGVGSRSVADSIPAICPVSVAIPVVVTTACPRPRVTAVFMNTAVTRSPSGASGRTCSECDFGTGWASPVRDDSWASRDAVDSSRPSAGTRSPASSTTTSPGTSSSASSRTMRASRRTVAIVVVICRSASSADSARDSWVNPMTPLSNTTTVIATGVSHSRATAALTTAAARRIRIIGLWNWRTNTRHRGSRVACANRLGPYRCSRRAASADDRPAPGSTSSRRVTSSAAIACQGGGRASVG